MGLKIKIEIGVNKIRKTQEKKRKWKDFFLRQPKTFFRRKKNISGEKKKKFNFPVKPLIP